MRASSRSCCHVSLLSVVTALLFAAQVARATNDDSSHTIAVEPPLRAAAVSAWTVVDVERWMNYTVGYGEYAQTIRLHGIDGPTLLFLSGREVEDHFNVRNSIHLAKLRAHLQLLRTGCVCTRQQVVPADFWSLLREENKRTWVFGITALFLPRAAVLGAYVWDPELLEALHKEPQTLLEEELLSFTADGSATAPPAPAAAMPALFAAMAALCPATVLLLKCASFVDVNCVLSAACVVHFIIVQYYEVRIVYLAVTRQLLAPGETWRNEWKTVLRMLVGYAGIAPVAAYVTSFFSAVAPAAADGTGVCRVCHDLCVRRCGNDHL